MIPWLDPAHPEFPNPELAFEEPDGLLAAGGNLSPDALVSAYRTGIFPWYSDGQPILWWSPNPRCVLFPDKVHVSRSLRKHLRKSNWQLSFDSAFSGVIDHCARDDSEDGTWITPEMKSAYTHLYHRGIAHSVEVWSESELIGGLYGLAIGRCFFGESMFSARSNASKVAFIALCRQLSNWGFAIIDCQVENPHLLSLGAEGIARRKFLSILSNNIDELSLGPAAGQQWSFDLDITNQI